MADLGTCQVESEDQIEYPEPQPADSCFKYLYLDANIETAEVGLRGKIQVEIKSSIFRSLCR